MVDVRVLVTGAAGFIGSRLCGELLKNPDHEVIGLDNFHGYYSRKLKESNLNIIQNKRFQFIEGSILDSTLLKTIKDIDVVYHYAAIAGVRYSIENPLVYFQINTLGTATILEAFRDVKKFVFASSSSVYGDVAPEHLPVNEDASLQPKAPYPLSKIHAEEICAQYESIYSTPMTILRFYTVYGAGQRPDEMFTKFISRILKGETIEVYGDGEQTRDFTHVSDIVSGSMAAASKGNGVYNLGSGRRVSVNHAISVISSVLGKTPVIQHVSPKRGEVMHTHADITKARKELGYEPAVKLEDGVKDCVSWCTRVVNEGLL